ncbi:MAG: putative LPS assembly protein LptD [Phocaeicola sp.]
MASLQRHRYIPFLLIIAGLFLSVTSGAQRRGGNLRTESADSLKTTTYGADSLAIDTTNNSKKEKQPLEFPVVYEAEDSIIFTDGAFAHLYGNGKIHYDYIELTSDLITMNMDSSTVFARGVTDSLGVEKGTPIFKDSETPYESKIMRYNFKSKKGFINNIVTQQGEGYVTSEESKKGADDNLYLRHGKYTTCDCHESPHFYLKLSMAKVRPKKNVVFGPAQLVIEDVALPIAIPFGFFPFNSSYSSGFIMPTYGDELNRGFYLRDGGYYFAINDKMDLKLLGEIFTKGSWGLSAQSNYAKRYKYNGSFSSSYIVTKTGEKNLPDYLETKDFKIAWSHRQDSKFNPNSTFSANVNFTTSSYDQRNLSSLYNPQQYSNNTKASSISYSHTFPEIGLSISSTFNVSQNTRDSSMSVTLPDLNISLNRLYPFKRKNGAGDQRWYEKISLQYTGQLTNSINTKDNLIFKQGIKDWKNGMQHKIPISATFTAFKFLNIIPSFSYTERWYTNRVEQSYDPTAVGSVRKDTISGFNRVYDYNASIQVNTKMYGFYKPMKALFGDKIEMIRHVITPSASFNYSPDFGADKYGYYKSYTYTDANGEVRMAEYSPYAGMAFSVPGKGKQGNINFSLDNNIEMKVKSDRDTTGVRKISLIDQLSANMSYNTAAKTQPWGDLKMVLRLKLSKSYTFNFNANFATYAYEYDKNGNVVRSDRTEWSYGRFGRFEGTSGSFSYTLDNDSWKKWFGTKEERDENRKKKEKKEEEEEEKYNNQDREEKEVDTSNIRKTEQAKLNDGYLAFKMPWSLSLSYSYSIREDRSKEINKATMRYPYSLSHSINANGSIKLGSRWNITYTSGYDFNAKELSMTSFNITRDLHCFTMSCGVVLTPYTSYNFSIRALSTMLTDALKFDQRSNTGSTVTWY